jgi:hypothetical protein
MRRNWVALDTHNTRCVVLNDKHNVKTRLSAYALTGARRLTAYDLSRYQLASSPYPHQFETAIRTYRMLDVACCYAFHCKATDSVKLGCTTKLFRRWSKLETDGGRLLQLVAVWQTDDFRGCESVLHERFAQHRRIGEWFDAAPVLLMLRETIASHQAAVSAAARATA